MTAVAEKQYERIGVSKGCADHDHDLVHELSKRLDAVWRMDQYIENSAEKPEIRKFWESTKRQETANVARLKDLIAEEIRAKCF